MRRATILAVLCSAALAAQQTPTNSNSAGTEGTVRTVPRAYATIQAAIQAASDGDRIVLSPGTYFENLDLLGKRVVIEGVTAPELTRIDGNSKLMPTLRATSKQSSGSVVRNLTITGGTGLPSAALKATDYYGAGVCAMGGATLRLENCHIVANGTKGEGATFGGGAYAGGKDTRIELVQCLVRGNHAWATGGATLADMEATVVHDRCTIVGNTARAWTFGHQGGVSVANSGKAVVTHSIVWDNAGFQVRAFGPPYDEGTKIDVTWSAVQYGIEGTGNLLKDPRFVDREKGDFRLLPDSPCIDAGDPKALRDPDGTPSDLGALPVARDLGPKDKVEPKSEPRPTGPGGTKGTPPPGK